MEIPCYDRCTTFYYYDVLEALSRHLFQQIVDEKKEKLQEEMMMETESDSMASKSMNDDQSQRSSAREDKKKKDTEGSEKVEEELSPREIEDREDLLKGSLEDILKKLEEKGAECKAKYENEIEKYKEMRLWRVKRDKIVRQ